MTFLLWSFQATHSLSPVKKRRLWWRERFLGVQLKSTLSWNGRLSKMLPSLRRGSEPKSTELSQQKGTGNISAFNSFVEMNLGLNARCYRTKYVPFVGNGWKMRVVVILPKKLKSFQWVQVLDSVLEEREQPNVESRILHLIRLSTSNRSPKHSAR